MAPVQKQPPRKLGSGQGETYTKKERPTSSALQQDIRRAHAINSRLPSLVRPNKPNMHRTEKLPPGHPLDEIPYLYALLDLPQAPRIRRRRRRAIRQTEVQELQDQVNIRRRSDARLRRKAQKLSDTLRSCLSDGRPKLLGQVSRNGVGHEEKIHVSPDELSSTGPACVRMRGGGGGGKRDRGGEEWNS